jgi:dethiobiotin synthetase
MSKGFFITGTDTGVGKTIAAGAIIKAMHFLGMKACAMKPIESGCGREGDVLIPYDGMFLKQITHMDEPLATITPCCFESPLAPMTASEVDMKEVNVAEIKKPFYRLLKKYDSIVVEGIGGLMVPIRKDYYALDLAGEFGLPLVVVARPGLGTINHIMLTVNCALREGLNVAGIILNYSAPPGNSISEKTNPKLLSLICPVPVIGIFPYLESVDEDALAQVAMKNLDLEEIKKYL